MSIQAISAAIALQGVSSSEKLLLIALANYADVHGTCYPSQSRLAKDTCLTDRSIRTLLKAVESRGLIDRTERVRGNMSRRSDHFTLKFLGNPAERIADPEEVISGPIRKLFPGGEEMASDPTTFEPSPKPSSEPIVALARCPTGVPARRSRRVPSDWTPSAAVLAVLTAEGFTSGDLERALTMMRDHEFRDARSDWDGTYRNWLRRDANFNPRKHHDDQLTHPAGPKRIAREANHDRAFSGAQAAARNRAVQP